MRVAQEIVLTDEERAELTRLVRSGLTSVRLAQRAHIVLLAENPGELLPTIRSRSSIFRLGALPPEQIEAMLAEQRKDWKPKQRALVARLAEGRIGQAFGFDLEGYLASRQDALVVLRTALREPDYSQLFKTTESYRGGADGQENQSKHDGEHQ